MGFKRYWGQQFASPHGIGGRISTLIMNNMNKPQYKAVENFFTDISTEKQDSNSGPVVLDIGFGNGYLLKKLSKKYPALYFGVDSSADMLKRAKKRCRDFKNNLYLGSAGNLPFEDEKFDLIFSVNTVYFWQNFEKDISHIFSKLKTGGKFINVFYCKDWLNKTGFAKQGFTKYDPKDLKLKTSLPGFEITLNQIKKYKSYYTVAIKQNNL